MKKLTLLGDCLELIPQHVPDKSVQLILADLPFGVTQHPSDIPIPMEDFIVYEVKGKEKVMSRSQFFDHMMSRGCGEIWKDIWDLQCQKGLWSHYKRVIADNGVIALFCQGLFFVDLVNSNRQMFRYDLIWDKGLTTGFLNARRAPLRQHEQIAIFSKKQALYNPQMRLGKPLHSKGKKYTGGEHVNQNYGKFIMTDDSRKGSRDKFPTSILAFRKPHPSVAHHRTEKSIHLLEWLIETYTNEGDTVLDNVAGSFTTGCACENTGRGYILMEKDPVEYQKGKARLEAHQPLFI